MASLYGTSYEPCVDDAVADFLILCRNHEFRVHKAVLSKESKFFEAMFRFQGKESNDGRLELSDDDDPELIWRMLNHIYMGVASLPPGAGEVRTTTYTKTTESSADGSPTYSHQSSAGSTGQKLNGTPLASSNAQSDNRGSTVPNHDWISDSDSEKDFPEFYKYLYDSEDEHIDVITEDQDTGSRLMERRFRSNKPGSTGSYYTARFWLCPHGFQSSYNACSYDEEDLWEHLSPAHIILEARMYCLADYFGIEQLKYLSKDSFKDAVHILAGRIAEGCPEFVEAIRVIFAQTRASDRGLRDVVVGHLTNFPRLWEQREIRRVMKEYGELTFDVLRQTKAGLCDEVCMMDVLRYARFDNGNMDMDQV